MQLFSKGPEGGGRNETNPTADTTIANHETPAIERQYDRLEIRIAIAKTATKIHIERGRIEASTMLPPIPVKKAASLKTMLKKEHAPYPKKIVPIWKTKSTMR